MNDKLVWINVCEASADYYGAMLMLELRKRLPGLELMGMGGPAMRARGLNTVFRSEDLSLVGLTEVFTALPRILVYLRKIKELMRSRRPAVVILMDAPDFNFRLARMAHSLNIPVLYYIAPQIWAWRESRVRFLKQYVDRVACIFPFEPAFFQRHGIKASFVGHPAMEAMDLDELEAVPRDNRQVAILPGSRKREISSLLPLFSSSARILHREYPDLMFNVVQAPGIKLDFLQRFCPSEPWIRFIPPEKRHQFMRKSRAAMAASGTVTLECAILEVPAVVAYRLSWLSYLAGRMLIRVKYISMPNLILGRKVFPELIQNRASVHNILSALRPWLDDPEQAAQTRISLKKIKTLLGSRSAAGSCADLALELMKIRMI